MEEEENKLVSNKAILVLLGKLSPSFSKNLNHNHIYNALDKKVQFKVKGLIGFVVAKG